MRLEEIIRALLLIDEVGAVHLDVLDLVLKHFSGPEAERLLNMIHEAQGHLDDAAELLASLLGIRPDDYWNAAGDREKLLRLAGQH